MDHGQILFKRWVSGPLGLYYPLPLLRWNPIPLVTGRYNQAGAS